MVSPPVGWDQSSAVGNFLSRVFEDFLAKAVAGTPDSLSGRLGVAGPYSSREMAIISSRGTTFTRSLTNSALLPPSFTKLAPSFSS